MQMKVILVHDFSELLPTLPELDDIPIRNQQLELLIAMTLNELRIAYCDWVFKAPVLTENVQHIDTLARLSKSPLVQKMVYQKLSGITNYFQYESWGVRAFGAGKVQIELY